MLYDFSPFIEVCAELGKALTPLAIPAIVAWLVLSWVADILFKS